MDLDLELYRREVRVSSQPLVRLSAIDICPDRPARTLVFIHGFGGNATQWQHQLRRFSDDSRVIALDLRGHGQSDKPAGEYTMAELLGDLNTALDVLGVSSPVVLLGHSFGGAVVTEFALAHPGRVAKLVLIATAGEYRLALSGRVALRLPLALLDLVHAAYARKFLSAPPRVMKLMHRRTVAPWNGWSMFRSLTLPTLVIRGHRDRVFAARHFEEVARAIPNAEEVDVGASGHMVLLERREAVNRAVERFLHERLGGAAPDEERLRLKQERPWLAQYDDGVPYTIGIPPVPLHRVLRSAARRFPLRAAIRFEGGRLTYRRLNRESSRFANLIKSLGLRPGDKVLLLLPNLPQTVIAFFGVLKAGGVAVFTTPLSPVDELVRQVRDSGATVLVTLTKLGETARAVKAQTGLKHILFTSVKDYLPEPKRLLFMLFREARDGHRLPFALEPGMHLLANELYKHEAHAPELETEPQAPALIQYTSGTTAQPKGVMLSHYNLIANALQTRHWIPALREGREIFLSVVPFSHVYGMTVSMNLPVAMAATMVILPQFHTETVLRTIQRYRPTIFPGVPNMYIAINNFPGVRRFGISSIKACISGGSALPMEVQEAFEKLTRGRLIEGYGLTEATTVTHGNPFLRRRKVGSIGIPLPSTEAKLIDLASGKDLPPGKIGELVVRGPQVMLGYRGDEAQPWLTRDGWLLTGDVARVDEDGYFHLIARKADMWYPAKPGQPAFPRDVEEVLFEIPQVREVAVIAIANQPVAFVIAQKDRPTAESLIAYCQRRLPPDLVPRLVIFVDDFPRTFIGKILRRDMAKRYADVLPPARRD
jgi:long-chain acyl-CoA synthetase